MRTPQKVLITGSSGLIGYAAYQHFAARPEQYELYALDHTKDLSRRTPQAWHFNMPDDRFFLCSLTDFEGLKQAVQGMDVVVHLAADPGGDNWESLRDSNLIGAYHLFEACRLAGVRRIVAASSITVSQGHRQQEPYKAMAERRRADIPANVVPVTTDIPAEPRSIYAATKVWVESLARTYAHVHGISCFCLRIGQVDRDWPRPPKGAAVFVSQRDVVQLIERCVNADVSLKFEVFYAVSNNDYRWVDIDDGRRKVGFVPQDRAEADFDYDA